MCDSLIGGTKSHHTSFMETESRIVVTLTWVERGGGEWSMSTVSVWKDECVLELCGGDGC